MINLSLSTTNAEWREGLHELTDRAFSSAADRRIGTQHAGRVLPLAVLQRDQRRQPRPTGPADVVRQPDPAGRAVRARGGRRGRLAGRSTISATGNSFATPHISGICALIRSKHPTLGRPPSSTC